eukprot:7694725-Pyramimonas_sp.AAC.2
MGEAQMGEAMAIEMAPSAADPSNWAYADVAEVPEFAEWLDFVFSDKGGGKYDNNGGLNFMQTLLAPSKGGVQVRDRPRRVDGRGSRGGLEGV